MCFAATVLCVGDEIPQRSLVFAVGPIHGVSIVGVLALWSHQVFQLPSDLGINFSRKNGYLHTSLKIQLQDSAWFLFLVLAMYLLTEARPLWQHYLCWSDVPVPRISVIFSLEELKEIEKDCAVYVGRMERLARHSSISKEEKVLGCGVLAVSALPFTFWGSGLMELPHPSGGPMPISTTFDLAPNGQ